MDLSAYFDDSSSDTGRRDLVFAGLVNSDDAWEKFSSAWSLELANPPTIKHLKMVEANALRGQFAGWTRDARDRKLQALANVLDRFRPICTFDISISRAEYEIHVSPASPRGLSTPYFTITFAAVSAVVRYLAGGGPLTPVAFVFDEQSGVNKDVALFFDYMAENLDPVARGLIKMPIGYGDDLRDIPLQAADMLAWHIRRQREGGEDPALVHRAEYLRSDSHVEMHIPPEMVLGWGAAFSEALPILQTLRTKGEWQRFRALADQAKRDGFRPPHGDDPVASLANIQAAWDQFRSKR